MPVFSRFWLDPDTNQADPGRLQWDGPVLPVEIHVHPADAAFLLAQDRSIPTPVTGMALFDTGASVTSIDARAVMQLGIPAQGTVALDTPGGAVEQDIFACQVQFPGTPLGRFDLSVVPASDLAPQGIVALIGRDLLRRFQFVYNGVDGFWTLAV